MVGIVVILNVILEPIVPVGIVVARMIVLILIVLIVVVPIVILVLSRMVSVVTGRELIGVPVIVGVLVHRPIVAPITNLVLESIWGTDVLPVLVWGIEVGMCFSDVVVPDVILV